MTYVSLTRRLPTLAPVPAPAAALLLAALVMTLGVLAPLAAVRAAVVLPIALLAPGYAVVVAAFGARLRLDAVPTLALSALLSMALYPLLSLVLNAVSIRLTTQSVIITTDALIVLLAAVIVVRAQRAASGVAARAFALAQARPHANGLRGGLFVAGALALTGLAVAVTMHLFPTPVDPKTAYAQFYLSGPWAHINTVVHAQPHKRLAVEIGITNQGTSSQVYRVVPLLDEAATWRGPGHDITIPAGGSWRGSVSGYVPAQGCVHRLGITLYVGKSRTPLGDLTVWVRGAPGMPAACTAGRASNP